MNMELFIVSRVTWWKQDIEKTYFYGNLKDPIYIIQTEGFHDRSGRVCLLQKVFYGLKQWGRKKNGTCDSQISWNPLDWKSSQKTMLAGSTWSFVKTRRPRKDFEIFWSLNSRTNISKSSNTYCMSVWSKWRMVFHSLNSSLFKNNANFKFDPLKVWCSSLAQQDEISYMPYQFFSNSFQIQLEDTGHWLQE